MIKSLLFFGGGAKLSQYLCDLTPKIIIVGCMNGGNPIFGDVLEETPLGTQINIEKLKMKIKSVNKILKAPLFIGVRNGFLINYQKLYEMSLEDEWKNQIILSSPGQLISFLEEVNVI